jgi:hypothetical protein
MYLYGSGYFEMKNIITYSKKDFTIEIDMNRHKTGKEK